MSFGARGLPALLLPSCLLLIVLTAQARDVALHGDKHLLGKSDELVTQYKERLDASRPRTVIFVCDHSWVCGGLGDRIKGFVSTFVLALLLDARFSASWEVPVRPFSQQQRQAQGAVRRLEFSQSRWSARSLYGRTSRFRRACSWMRLPKR